MQIVARRWGRSSFQQQTLDMGPGLRRDDDVDVARAIHSVSSWRKPGPITQDAAYCAPLEPQFTSTTRPCGYGSWLSPGRRAGRGPRKRLRTASLAPSAREGPRDVNQERFPPARVFPSSRIDND